MSDSAWFVVCEDDEEYGHSPVGIFRGTRDAVVRRVVRHALDMEKEREEKARISIEDDDADEFRVLVFAPAPRGGCTYAAYRRAIETISEIEHNSEIEAIMAGGKRR